MATITVTVRAPSWPRRLGLWRRLRAARAQVVSAALIVSGLAGMAGGAALIGTWCVGLVLIAESGGVLWFGLFRDDGTPLPRLPGRGGPRTHEEILEAARYAP